MRLLLLDRDGVILRHVNPYVLTWNDVEYSDGACETIAYASQLGFVPFVVTNQSPIGRGLVPWSFVDAVNQTISRTVRALGGRIEGFAVCPHVPFDQCACRKPCTGLLEMAAKQTGLSMEDAWLVGDASSDIEAGRRAHVGWLFHICSGRDQSICGDTNVTCISSLQLLREYLDTPSNY